jgi:predicted exporter
VSRLWAPNDPPDISGRWRCEKSGGPEENQMKTRLALMLMILFMALGALVAGYVQKQTDDAFFDIVRANDDAAWEDTLRQQLGHIVAAQLFVVCGVPREVIFFHGDGRSDVVMIDETTPFAGLTAKLKALPKEKRRMIVIDQGCGVAI